MIVIGIWIKNDFVFLMGLLTVGGLVGFLRYNYHPASIFMGEVGSLQLGYLMAFFSIEAMKMAGSHQVYFLVSLVIFAVPMTDTLVAFLRRLGKGQSPFIADKEHIHHRLLNLGLSHLQTVWLMYFFTVLYVSIGILMFYFEGWLSLFLFAMAFLLAIFWLYRLGYVETRLSWQNLINQLQKSMAVKTRAPLHFNRIWHRLIMLIVDIITINFALYAMHWLKFRSGLLPSSADFRPVSEYFISPVFLLLLLAWIFLFFANNLYHLDWDISRSEKSWRISKVITFGIILIGFLTIDLQQIINRSQILSLAGYWIFMIGFVNGGRLIVIEIEKRFKIFEYSPKKTIIVGCNEFGKKALSDIQYNPHLIYDVVGFVSKKERLETYSGLPVLGTYTHLPELIHRHKIEEVIIAIPESSSQDFINIVSLCEPQGIKIKSIPGKAQLIPGRQLSLGNHAFSQIFLNRMVIWQWIMKRLFDVFASILLMVLLSPFLLFTTFYILIRFKKSVIVKVPILGKNGIPFNMYVFRLTRKNYHFEVNPVYLGTMPLANEKSRYLNFLFQYRFYKLSQLINVLLGDMSIIGPRPEPMEWYQKYSWEVNFLHRRIMVRPGLTGLAQVKYHYELSRKLLQEWVRYDMFYAENLSLRMDLSILLRTILMVFVKKYKDSSEDIKTHN
jgi:lipopolysaccharide/colanic/teichoic acid biosynthesis glycosyltransferase